MNAHEVLRFRLAFAGSLDHPSMIFERSLIEEHGSALHDHAVAAAQLVECRRSMARMHEDLMGLLDAAVTLANAAAGWCEHEEAVAVVKGFRSAYGAQ